MMPLDIKPTLVGLVLTAACCPAPAQIYKSVAPDGTVVYSDQPPTANAEPMTVLPELTVVASSRTSSRETVRDRREDGDEAVSPSQRYAEFRLLQPTPDQTYWNTAYTLTVQASSAQSLAPGHRVRFLVDGEPRGESQTFSILLTEVYRGEHSVRAEIIDERGNVVATTQAVTFHMKQTSVQQ